ncbi:thioredoxin family protein [Phenylobacterium sp. LjRoot219]|uniref:thioredoxin family protein n=1 Tax=Phenylobacterium sp. LjRoot219 TaxID=3342283 RepID=UPI003ED14ADB
MPTSKVPPFDLGAPLPPFRLPEPLTGRLVGPEDFPEAQAILVAFLCNDCPDVQHLAGALSALTRDLDLLGLRTLAVNSAEAPPDAVAAEALRQGYVFPYLIDQTRAVARAYQAVCTPDFYLFGRDGRLAYHGRFDDTRFGGGRPAHGGDLRRAITRVLKGEPASDHQVAAQGCGLWPTPATRAAARTG